MANRYWVGGSGYWSDDDNHWATSSGGPPANGNIPTSSDDVFIDSNSGFGSGGTITLDTSSNAEVHDFICTSSHSYTIDRANTENISIFGSLLFESGINLTEQQIQFKSVDNGETITTGGVEFPSVTFGEVDTPPAGSWTLQDNLIITDRFYQENGTFDANDHNVTANDFYFYADTGYTPTVIMGSGTWEATGVGTVWNVDEYSGEVLTINAETSIIKTTYSDSNPRYFYLGSENPLSTHIYNNLWIDGDCSRFDIYGSNTFNEFKVTSDPTIIRFQGTSVTTVNTFILSGSLGNLISLDISNSGQFTLFKSSGVVECDYLNISNSNATGGATWYAGSHSVDTTNNDGWMFEDAPEPPVAITTVKNTAMTINSLSHLGFL